MEKIVLIISLIKGVGKAVNFLVSVFWLSIISINEFGQLAGLLAAGQILSIPFRAGLASYIVSLRKREESFCKIVKYQPSIHIIVIMIMMCALFIYHNSSNILTIMFPFFVALSVFSNIVRAGVLRALNKVTSSQIPENIIFPGCLLISTGITYLLGSVSLHEALICYLFSYIGVCGTNIVLSLISIKSKSDSAVDNNNNEVRYFKTLFIEGQKLVEQNILIFAASIMGMTQLSGVLRVIMLGSTIMLTFNKSLSIVVQSSLVNGELLSKKYIRGIVLRNFSISIPLTVIYYCIVFYLNKLGDNYFLIVISISYMSAFILFGPVYGIVSISPIKWSSLYIIITAVVFQILVVFFYMPLNVDAAISIFYLVALGKLYYFKGLISKNDLY